MDLSIRMRIIFDVKHLHLVRLKVGDISLTSLTKLVVQVKASICSKTKENLLLYCRKFSMFVIVMLI